MRFIAQLTGDWATNKDEASPQEKLHLGGTSAESEAEDTAVEEAILKGIFETSGTFANGVWGLLTVGQGFGLGVRGTETFSMTVEPTLSFPLRRRYPCLPMRSQSMRSGEQNRRIYKKFWQVMILKKLLI